MVSVLVSLARVKSRIEAYYHLRKSIPIKSGAASGDRGGSDVEEGDQLLVDEEQGAARADHL